jgi:hypothetical protein
MCKNINWSAIAQCHLAIDDYYQAGGVKTKIGSDVCKYSIANLDLHPDFGKRFRKFHSIC